MTGIISFLENVSKIRSQNVQYTNLNKNKYIHMVYYTYLPPLIEILYSLYIYFSHILG
jgi:hypothetical protein